MAAVTPGASVAEVELAAEVQRFARQLATACAGRGIETDDVVGLRSYLKPMLDSES